MGVWPTLLACVIPRADLIAQEVPEWRLADAPRVEVGRGDVALDRVRTAGSLSDGGFVVADGGNSQILVFSPAGGLVRQLGREGAGPGEFRTLWSLSVIRDTIVAYDPGLNRVSLWNANGDLIATIHLPVVEGRNVQLQAVISRSQYVVSTLQRGSANRRDGLLRDTVDLLLVEDASPQPEPLGRREWGYTYVYHHDAGGGATASTAYRTPFLGKTLVTGAGGRIAIVPLDSALVELVDPRNASARTVSLPIQLRPFDRTVVDRYRDSLVATIARNGRSARGGAVQRLQEVFGSDFPLPEYAPAIRDARGVGQEVWLRATPSDPGARTTSWYVVDVLDARVIGHLVLPSDWEVLGGDGETVLVLRRDELDVEYVSAYDIVKFQENH